jgi:His/Glu/Gln/Arg/opine family amino acid ABC transporter permease subunit
VTEDLATYGRLLLSAAGTTIWLSWLALLIGALGGTALGLFRTSHWASARWLAITYIEVFRSLPIIIVMFFCYFGAPLVFKIDLSTFASATVALALSSSAMMAEVVRAGFESVAKGQWEASRAAGMSYGQIMRYVVGPQALRVILPPSVGVYIATLKESSLAAVIGYVELTKTGLLMRESLNGSFLPLVAVAALYFVINYTISLGGGALERRFEIKTQH